MLCSPSLATPTAAPVRRFAVSGLLGATALLALVLSAFPAWAADSEEADEIPPPEELILKTGDGFDLHVTFYPGTQEKQSVPILMIHGFKGKGQEFDDLAIYLQEIGHAVIVPDLRGHGESVEYTDPNSGATKKLKADSLRPDDFANMVKFDLEAVKKFLLQKNNEGELNIEKLCVIGSEMGALIALNWAAVDWSWPQLTTGKQGQDVRALVLISPESNFKGVRSTDAMAHPGIRSQLSIMLIAGAKKGSYKEEVNRLFGQFEKAHREPAPDEAGEKQDLFRELLPTSLQGTKLLNENSFKLNQKIADFITRRLVKQKLAWATRKNPLD